MQETTIFSLFSSRTNSPFGNTMGSLVLTNARLKFTAKGSRHQFHVPLNEIADVGIEKANPLYLLSGGLVARMKITLTNGQTHIFTAKPLQMRIHELNTAREAWTPEIQLDDEAWKAAA